MSLSARFCRRLRQRLVTEAKIFNGNHDFITHPAMDRITVMTGMPVKTDFRRRNGYWWLEYLEVEAFADMSGKLHRHGSAEVADGNGKGDRLKMRQGQWHSAAYALCCECLVHQTCHAAVNRPDCMRQSGEYRNRQRRFIFYFHQIRV